MQEADIVLYDRLISPEILSLINPAAQMVYVGKQAGFHTRTQYEISQLLGIFATDPNPPSPSSPSPTTTATTNQTNTFSSSKNNDNDSRKRRRLIVRLKGGDPYIFGRGGEEVEYLQSLGVEVYVTPGITAASGIGAELGIPMTSRGVATSVKYITGHFKEGSSECLGEVDPGMTLVVYMGLGRLKEIVEELGGKGVRRGMPAVAVERGCTREQRVVWGTVKELAGKVEEVGLRSPTLIIIGEVVALARGWKKEYGEVVEGEEIKENKESVMHRARADVAV